MVDPPGPVVPIHVEHDIASVDGASDAAIESSFAAGAKIKALTLFAFCSRISRSSADDFVALAQVNKHHQVALLKLPLAADIPLAALGFGGEGNSTQIAPKKKATKACPKPPETVRIGQRFYENGGYGLCRDSFLAGSYVRLFSFRGLRRQLLSGVFQDVEIGLTRFDRHLA